MARDVGPTCVVDDHGAVRGVDWQFNAWGGMVDGLYAHWEKEQRSRPRHLRSTGHGLL